MSTASDCPIKTDVGFETTCIHCESKLTFTESVITTLKQYRTKPIKKTHLVVACGQCGWATPVVTKDKLKTLSDAQHRILDCTTSGLSLSRKAATDNHICKATLRAAANEATKNLDVGQYHSFIKPPK